MIKGFFLFLLFFALAALTSTHDLRSSPYLVVKASKVIVGDEWEAGGNREVAFVKTLSLVQITFYLVAVCLCIGKSVDSNTLLSG